MPKEEAIVEFIRHFKIALNTASLYAKDHPYFLKSIEDLTAKTNDIFEFQPSLKISVSPEQVFLDDKLYEKKGATEEIAQLLHRRKIRSLEIIKGVELFEMIALMNNVSKRPKELLAAGGLLKTLKQGNVTHINIEELDYSEFLKDEGEEVKDIWTFLLREALETNDRGRLKDLADNFIRLASKLKVKDILEDEEFAKNFGDFMEYLRLNESERFKKCSQELCRVILQDAVSSGVDHEKVKRFFKNLSVEDLAEVLLSQMTKNENFNKESFDFFSHLVDKDKLKDVAKSFSEKLNTVEYLREKSRAKKKMHDLFSYLDNPFVSEVYRNSLSLFLTNLSFEDKFFFDQEMVHSNYRLILLELLEHADRPDSLELVLKQIADEAPSVIEKNDQVYLKALVDKLTDSKKKHLAPSQAYVSIDKKLAEFGEKFIFQGGGADLDYIIEYIPQSSMNAESYFEIIFQKEFVSLNILKLFFKFFPEDLDVFCGNIEDKGANLKFIENLIENLKNVQNRNAIGVLKSIYNISNDLMKIEVLRSFQNRQENDYAFLLSVIKDGGVHIKREALISLRKDKFNLDLALEGLLRIKSRFGRNNEIIMDNMNVISELSIGEAEPYLSELARRPFIWNRKLRIKAREILKKIHD